MSRFGSLCRRNFGESGLLRNLMAKMGQSVFTWKLEYLRIMTPRAVEKEPTRNVTFKSQDTLTHRESTSTDPPLLVYINPRMCVYAYNPPDVCMYA